jgi:hypothetical protein
MTIVVSLFIALAGLVFMYSIGQGGPVAGMVFLAILFVGALLRVTAPARDRLKP